MELLHETLRAIADYFASSLVADATQNMEEPTLGVVSIVAEVHGKDGEGSSATSVTFYCSDGRGWVQRGLFREAIEASHDARR